MARTAVGRTALDVRYTEANTDVGVGDSVGRVDHIMTHARDIANGTSDGQADRVYSTSGTASTTPTDIDLSGSLASVIGAGTTVFVELQTLCIQNTGTVNLQIGGNAAAIPLTAATNDIMLLPPGGTLFWDFGTSGLAITATTADILRLLTGSGTTTYRLVVAGRSA